MYKLRSQHMQSRLRGGRSAVPGTAEWMRQKQQTSSKFKEAAKQRLLRERLDLEAVQAQRGIKRSASPGGNSSAPLHAQSLAGLRRSPRKDAAS